MTLARSQRLFTGSVAVALLVAAVVGVMLLGPPGVQRTRRIDERRVEDLARIAAAVERYHALAGGLPADLSAIDPTDERALDLRDAATGSDYEYARTGATSYRLCAAFATDSSREVRARYVPPPEWAHAAGRHCYERKVPRR